MKYTATGFFIIVCLSAYSQNIDSTQYFFQKGVEEKSVKHFLVASKLFDKAIKLNQKFANAYIENGYANLEMHKTDAALFNFSNANELEPKNPLVIKELTQLYFNYNQFAKAIAFAQQCNTCDNAAKIIAISYFKTEDYAKAEKALKILLLKNSNDAELNYTLGRTYIEMEQEPKAISYYQKAIQLNNTKANWFLELGLINYTLNDYKNAVINFNAAAEKGVIQSNDFKENLGFSYIYSGEFDKGEKMLLDVLERKPGNKDLLRDIADAYYQTKKYDKCLEFCQKMLEQDKNNSDALYIAGQCFIKKGETERGQAMCDRAIQLNPELAKLKKLTHISAGL